MCVHCLGTRQDRRDSRPLRQPTTGEPWWAQDACRTSRLNTQADITTSLCSLCAFDCMLKSSLFSLHIRASSWCTTSQTRSPLRTSRTGWRASKKWGLFYLFSHLKHFQGFTLSLCCHEPLLTGLLNKMMFLKGQKYSTAQRLMKWHIFSSPNIFVVKEQ